MTQKELLYIMDTVNHLKHFAESLNEVKDELQNESSKQVVCSVLSDTISFCLEFAATKTVQTTKVKQTNNLINFFI